jgi:hypothetical protein
MSVANSVIVYSLLALAYLVTPAALIVGWIRWSRRTNPRTPAIDSSFISFALASSSAALAAITLVFAQFHHFRFYDPVLLPERRPRAIVVANSEMPRTNAVLIQAHLAEDPKSPTSRQRAAATLVVGASYEGAKRPVLIDPAHVSFHVVSDGSSPVLRVDLSTGNIMPIRLGHALVETMFEGVANRTCVIVEPEDASTSNPSVCNDLLMHGQRLSFDDDLRTPRP